jgi:pyridoxal phosphate enzyme (YggS family)
MRSSACHKASPMRGSVISHRRARGWRDRIALDYSRTMLSTDTPAARLAAVREKLGRAARAAGRAPEAIELIAISKTHPAEEILPLIEAGQTSFGENRVQEAQGKWLDLKAAHPSVRLHLVGQLQSNKADDAVALFDAIHSLDRPSLADALAKAIAKTDRHPALFVQVNIGEEVQKGGCAIAELPGLLAHCSGIGLAVAGLMCVPPADTEAAPYFALLAKLARDHSLDQLSMGMSGDYETATMLGATCVRVGTALFGARP